MKIKLRIFTALLCYILICALLTGCDPEELKQVTNLASGYTSVAYIGKTSEIESFLACGTGGRLDKINSDKSVENIPVGIDKDLLQVAIWSDITLVCGRQGTLLYSQDSKTFSQCKLPTKADILGIARFRSMFFACTVDGTILESDDAITWRKTSGLTNSKPILSIAANDDYIMAITADTDIYLSKDGVEWIAQNFNDIYDGYYEKYIFTKIVNMGSFFILGYAKDDPGSPIAIYSDSGGEVWMFVTLNEINDQDPSTFMPMKYNAICPFNQQMLAACDNGRILILDSCSKCHKIETVSDVELRGAANGSDYALVVGGDFKFKMIDALTLRVQKMTAEEAQADIEEGAILVDVRPAAEYKKSRIIGSVNIPLDEIEAKLKETIRSFDQELIFYCEDGTNAQIALEKAQELGYIYAYNLGGLADWPYGVEE